jgi:hypothetical protein
MTVWEQRIVDAFTGRYPASAAASVAVTGAVSGAPSEDRPPRPLRLRLDRIFPGFIDASADNRESFLEAVESLEQRGLIVITWARHRKGEIPSALACPAPERLFELTGTSSPRLTAEKVRDLALGLAAEAAESGAGITGSNADTAGGQWAAFFSFLAQAFTPLDAAGGIDAAVLGELARLAGFLEGEAPARSAPARSAAVPSVPVPGAGQNPCRIPGQGPGPRPPGDPGRFRGITTRALSVALYGDSKRLEYLCNLFNPLVSRARRRGIEVPDFSFLDRSFPETFIAGNIVFDIEGAAEPFNAGGNVVGLFLETILKLRRIRPLAGKAGALTIENKETFFVLAESLPDYACFLYVGGHPNRAVRALVSLLADSGFDLYHAGDLDPDGILILQELGDMAGKALRPLRMDAPTFDRYLDCGRKLEPSALKRTALISETTRSIPGIAELIGRIETTGMGVEQEIIDYRPTAP